ncbi:fam-a protein [Plasmodium chabaudi chabaudi]|uniref:Fam-a protein n=1 Tax=Plasmodium chabaudi chabaudi TaxID=31271 RepID=A0A1C6X2E4_PLACU|nr:fam-a protein [Plasmodium chabaudi chabaudi]
MNKFYIQITLFLLTIFAYANNKALATELDSEGDTSPESIERYLTSEEIYEENKHLLCTNPEEIKHAEKLMSEALSHFKYHAVKKSGYNSYGNNPFKKIYYYKKTQRDGTTVDKVEYTVRDSDKYDEEINKLWDPNHGKSFNMKSPQRKIIRVYNPNLVLIQQRYKHRFGRTEKYFYALVTKVEVSKDTTAIVMTSPNINDHYPSGKKFKNRIIENANLLKIDVDPEDDIKEGLLKKTFVNLAGYLIQKKDKCVDATFIASIDGHSFV